ncbi:MAG: DUF192 domain-containing protein [Candidatus Aenigmatarchaeota archaeon]
MRYVVLTGIIIIICLLLIFAYGISGNKQARVCFESNCFDVSLALTPEERSRGLMFVEHLDDDRGMLFVFDRSGIYPFWMKNTLIPLDIIWLDSDSSVVFISRDTQPCISSTCDSTNPEKQASYVLEINAGISDRMNIDIGDKMTMVLD